LTGRRCHDHKGRATGPLTAWMAAAQAVDQTHHTRKQSPQAKSNNTGSQLLPSTQDFGVLACSLHSVAAGWMQHPATPHRLSRVGRCPGGSGVREMGISRVFWGRMKGPPAFTPADPGPNAFSRQDHAGARQAAGLATDSSGHHRKACGRVADHDAGPGRSLLRGRRRHSMSTVFPMTTCLLTVSGSHLAALQAANPGPRCTLSPRPPQAPDPPGPPSLPSDTPGSPAFNVGKRNRRPEAYFSGVEASIDTELRYRGW
jgi:hypothetical protein